MKRFLSILLSLIMVFSCAGALAEDNETLTLEVYDVAANFQGMQPGWYAKVVKDLFNIELNIIAPQQSGDAQYATRTASGFLGDIILLDNADMQDCIAAGLIKDISALYADCPDLKAYDEPIQALNKSFEGVADGQIYAIPCQMCNSSPTSFSEDKVYSSPMLPWDFYTEQGAPEMANLDDLLDVLAKIQAAHSTNADGDPAYALSLWPDWDSDYMENVAQLTKWYGQETLGSVLLGADGSIVPLTDKDGAYYRILNFLFKANQMGLIDPDSGTQDWNAACDKMGHKRVYLMWYSWQLGFWNTASRGAERQNFMYSPVKDMNFYQPGDYYYGDGRCIAVGSKVSDENAKRIMEFLNYYISPDGATTLHDGMLGYNYYILPDGRYELTEHGESALMANLAVPEELGGGNYNDGICKINQWLTHSASVNPKTGEQYNSNFWSTTLKKNDTATTQEWSAKYGAINQVEYLKSQNMISIVPSVNVNLPSDTTEIGLIRSQTGKIVKETSWQMVFAKDEAEFEAMWDAMIEKLEGFGWDELVEFDTDKQQIVVDLRNASK
ncbi:MAG: sugar ABC transporter substrate-binding protein [Eubacteriales bacterium]|nr:sugar ABC transporter substrate-binding protein [Eubacteriales bacterium]MDD3881303.1 sugar ABC transporter substrate-binding protein [Eubacteriales bacterium]MDD4512221.1 sugar ABC transporter substrate-binding protein [Eubacteriales bacterium]